MSDYTKRDPSHAAFTAALQDCYARSALRPDTAFRNGNLPASLRSVSDLNFLGQNPLCQSDIVLVSAGQYFQQHTGHTMFTTHDSNKVTVYGDSGGYQFIHGTEKWQGDTTRHMALSWLEKHTDFAMTLDIPTAAIEQEKSEFHTYGECLSTTLESLRFFDQQRTGRTRFLNVLQGRTQAEADDWYAAVKDFDFDGWAFAGNLRLDFYEVCRRILILVRHGKINQKQDRIHLLGTARLSVAVMLTALQRALRQHLQLPSLTITFDSGAPFLMAGMYRVYGDPRCEPTRNGKRDAFRLDGHQAPLSHHYIGSQAAVPFRSPIAAGLVNGDLCVDPHPTRRSAWDSWTSIMLANHNLSCLFSALGYANSIMDLQTPDAEARAPYWLVKAVWVIRHMFEMRDPMSFIKQHRTWLSSLAPGGAGSDDEDDAEQRFE